MSILVYSVFFTSLHIIFKHIALVYYNQLLKITFWGNISKIGRWERTKLKNLECENICERNEYPFKQENELNAILVLIYFYLQIWKWNISLNDV